DRVVHELEVPDALAGLQIDGHQAVAEQVVARTMAAEIVTGRIFNRQVCHAERFVDGDLRPDTGVAGVLERLFLPRVAAEFSRDWNGVEDPQALAGARVEAAHVALGVLHALRRRAGTV